MQIREHVGNDRPAIVLHPSGAEIGFGELESRANRLAHHFRASGLREGDVVAVVMENNEHIHAVMWAARRCGLYYVLVNTHLTAAEAAYIVGNCGARAIIGSAATRTVCAELESELAQGLPVIRLIADDDLDGWRRYPQCVHQCSDHPVAGEREGDLLQYSSGTTGRPKGIKRELSGTSPADAPCLLEPLLTAVGVTGDAVYLNPAPVYHTAPAYWSMSIQSLGATTVILERFDPEQALAAIERHRVTHAQFVPAMFVRMLKLPESVRNSYDLSSLRRVVHAAAPCPVDIKRAMIAWWGPIIDEFYSSSEGAGTSFIIAEEWLAHPGSVGRPLVGIPHIVGDDGLELPAGEVGDVYFEGGLDFTYHNDLEKTVGARNAQGWATVGDVGYVDADGYLYLTDRRHHVIISGGVNIYPREAEDALVAHPKVLDAAVIGVPDADMGQAVCAVVQTVNPADATPELAHELLDWTRNRLAHYKCPRSLHFDPQLPRTEAGKLNKQGLLARFG